MEILVIKMWTMRFGYLLNIINTNHMKLMHWLLFLSGSIKKYDSEH